MKKKELSFFYKNGITITFLTLFIITLIAQFFFGWKEHNQELTEHQQPSLSLSQYFQSAHFTSATFENFQSEFLQMAMFVIFTIFLKQIGSSESKDCFKEEEVDKEPVPSTNAPWPVNRGGWILALYKNSLSIALLLLFFISWAMHLYGSFSEYNIEQGMEHKPEISLSVFLKEPVFWFETFQNWQSEFLSVVALVVLSIYLRQKGSPQSKPVDAPHMQTGS